MVMKNRRPKGKKILSSWMWENDIQKLKQFATENDVTISDLIRSLIRGLDTMEIKVLNKLVTDAKTETKGIKNELDRLKQAEKKPNTITQIKERYLIIVIRQNLTNQMLGVILNIDGKEYKLFGWIRTAKKSGDQFFSIGVGAKG